MYAPIFVVVALLIIDHKLLIAISSAMTSKSNIIVILGVIGNITSVVGIVIMNKYITEVDGFDYMVFLSFLHFLITSIGMQVMLWLNFFTKPTVSSSNVIPVAVGSLMSVAFMNLNLSYNSVGFYQVLWILSIRFQSLYLFYVCFFSYRSSLAFHSLYLFNIWHTSKVYLEPCS